MRYLAQDVAHLASAWTCVWSWIISTAQREVQICESLVAKTTENSCLRKGQVQETRASIIAVTSRNKICWILYLKRAKHNYVTLFVTILFLSFVKMLFLLLMLLYTRITWLEVSVCPVKTNIWSNLGLVVAGCLSEIVTNRNFDICHSRE